jgi:hypothetical protein
MIIVFALIGILSFLAIYGTNTLNVTYTDWIKVNGDLTMHFLGWSFYRNDPWTFPIGKFTSYGYPNGNTVTYTDSIPLFAIPLKLLNPILPKKFQYFGLWELFCFAMQGIFAGLLLNLWSKNRWVTLIGVVFFIFSPIMLRRVFTHCALSGHWIILYSWYLFFKAKKNKISILSWMLACILATLINPYFTGMVLMIYLGYEFDEAYKNRKILTNIKRCLLLILIFIIIGWVSGFLYLGTSVSANGFGYYSMNLNALWNPLEWSKIIKALPAATPGQYEGYNYLGLGMIFLLLTAIFFRIKNRNSFAGWQELKKQPGILVIIIPLFILAISNKITFGNHVLLDIPLPHKVGDLCAIFRSSGRMFWPVFYLIYLFSFGTLCQQFTGKNSRRILLLLLFTMLVFQIGDMSHGLKNIRKRSSVRIIYQSPLQSGFWKEAAQKYRHIAILPPNPKVKNDLSDYNTIALYAVKNGMTINTGYFSRYRWDKLYSHANQLTGDLKKGIIDKEILYIIKDPKLFNELAAVISIKHIGYAYKIDTFNVLSAFAY